jgi:DNA-binding Lrp family transcriptional regulator
MRRLAELLANGEMPRDRIRLAMHISESGCRNYLNELEGAGIVKIVGRVLSPNKIPGQLIYKLVADAETVKEYFDTALGKPRPKVDRLAGIGRQLHILADDGPYTVKLLRVLPVHDPLHAAFFGSRVAA